MSRELHRKNKQLSKLKAELDECLDKIEKISSSKLDSILDEANIDSNYSLLIKEIFSSSKVKNSKSNRYSHDWILNCLLVHMKSSSMYKYLIDEKMLPLPSVSTVKK